MVFLILTVVLEGGYCEVFHGYTARSALSEKEWGWLTKRAVVRVSDDDFADFYGAIHNGPHPTDPAKYTFEEWVSNIAYMDFNRETPSDLSPDHGRDQRWTESESQSMESRPFHIWPEARREPNELITLTYVSWDEDRTWLHKLSKSPPSISL